MPDEVTTTESTTWEPGQGEEKSVETEEKSTHQPKPKAEGDDSGAYIELTGIIIGRSTGAHPGEPTIVTIQVTGGQDLTVSFPSLEAAKKVPKLVDKEGKPRTIPVKIMVMPGEGAPTEAEVEEEDEEEAENDPLNDPFQPVPDQAQALSRREAASKGETLPSDDYAKLEEAKAKAKGKDKNKDKDEDDK